MVPYAGWSRTSRDSLRIDIDSVDDARGRAHRDGECRNVAINQASGADNCALPDRAWSENDRSRRDPGPTTYVDVAADLGNRRLAVASYLRHIMGCRQDHHPVPHESVFVNRHVPRSRIDQRVIEDDRWMNVEALRRPKNRRSK